MFFHFLVSNGAREGDTPDAMGAGGFEFFRAFRKGGARRHNIVDDEDGAAADAFGMLDAKGANRILAALFGGQVALAFGVAFAA